MSVLDCINKNNSTRHVTIRCASGAKFTVGKSTFGTHLEGVVSVDLVGSTRLSKLEDYFGGEYHYEGKVVIVYYACPPELVDSVVNENGGRISPA